MKKKIAIFQYDLLVGGIQKSLVNLLNAIDYKKYDIDLYLFNKNIFFNNVNKNVNIYFLPKYPYFFRLISFPILFHFLKTKITKEYDIAIDFNSYSMECAINCLKVKSKIKYIWGHNDIKQKYKEELKYRILFEAFHQKYKYFNKIIAVSRGVKVSLMDMLNLKKHQIQVIPNLILADEIIAKSKKKTDFHVDKNYYNLISVGRLTHQKGFDILLNNMKQAIKENNKIRLYIIGDGPLFLKLKAFINKNNMQNNVFLLGRQNNPYVFMKQMDSFILTSRYEGQGMVFLEAKVLGLNIIMPKHLEKYITDIKGYKEWSTDFLTVKNENKVIDDLKEYNTSILNKLNDLLGEGK